MRRTRNNSDHERYQDLVRTVQSNSCLWMAETSDETPLLLSNEVGEELVLVWPTVEAARKVLSARPNLSEYSPVQKELHHWLRTVTPRLTEGGILVAAFPNELLSCLRVPAKSFANDLSAKPQLQSTGISRLRRKLQKRQRGEA